MFAKIPWEYSFHDGTTMIGIVSKLLIPISNKEPSKETLILTKNVEMLR